MRLMMIVISIALMVVLLHTNAEVVMPRLLQWHSDLVAEYRALLGHASPDQPSNPAFEDRRLQEARPLPGTRPANEESRQHLVHERKQRQEQVSDEALVHRIDALIARLERDGGDR